MSVNEELSPVERRVLKSFEDPDMAGRPLSRRARQTKRSLEAYLRAGVLPRYVTRLREIQSAVEAERLRLAAAHRMISRACGRDSDLFARRWRARVEAWSFEPVNRLIREHNEWYPVERNLPLDPRTGDYVKIRGRSYRRAELGPEWAFEQFPLSGGGASRGS